MCMHTVCVMVSQIMTVPCEGNQSVLWNILQPTSRRFLRELDGAPGGNNLQYIYYSVLAFQFLHSLVTVRAHFTHKAKALRS